LVKLDVKTDQVYAIPGRYTENGRTYVSALALRDWLKIHAPSAKSVMACDLEISRLGKPIGKQDQYMAAFGGLTVLEIDKCIRPGSGKK